MAGSLRAAALLAPSAVTLGLGVWQLRRRGVKEALLEAEQGWAIGVVNLTYATVLSLACSFVSIFAYQLVRNVGHLALGDHREGELLLTQSHHRHVDLSMRSLGHSAALAMSQSSSSSAATSSSS